MTDSYQTKDILADHRGLYKEILKDSSTDLTSSFREKVDALVKRVVKQMEVTTSLEDYRKLKDALVKWQMVYINTFNTSRVIKIPPPTRTLLPTIRDEPSFMDEQRIREWISKWAYFRAFFHERGEHEEKQDYHHAEIMFASEVLDGNLNLTKISVFGYSLLESIWLREVKVIRAYFRWKSRGGSGHGHDKEDYNEVCGHLREMLVDADIKASPAEFFPLKTYIEEKYLTSGVVDNEKAFDLINTKAGWAAEVRSDGQPEEGTPTDDWVQAETYVHMFYGKIVGAVLDKDEDSTLAILRAFQYRKVRGESHHIINCFEAALAIYFLDKNLVQELWEKSRDAKWVDCSCVEVKKNTSLGRHLIFDMNNDVERRLSDRLSIVSETVGIKGVMSDDERRVLTGVARRAFRDDREGDEMTNIIDDLYEMSRIVKKESTF